MSNSLQDIHPYVSQRLVTLFDIVARRYQKIVLKQQQRDENFEKVRHGISMMLVRLYETSFSCH